MNDVSERMTLAELEQTREYQRLTPKQRLFVATYCESGRADGRYDPVAAVKTAYECLKPNSARVMSYWLLSNIRIIAVLNLHFKAKPIDEFLVTIDRAINNNRLTIAQIQALKLKCEVMGLANQLPASRKSREDEVEVPPKKPRKKAPEKTPVPEPDREGQRF